MMDVVVSRSRTPKTGGAVLADRLDRRQVVGGHLDRADGAIRSMAPDPVETGRAPAPPGPAGPLSTDWSNAAGPARSALLSATVGLHSCLGDVETVLGRADEAVDDQSEQVAVRQPTFVQSLVESGEVRT